MEGLTAVSVAAGRSFTLVAAADGSVYSWGTGALGRSAIAGDHRKPNLVQGVGPKTPAGSVYHVAAAEWAALALTDNGTVSVEGAF